MPQAKLRQDTIRTLDYVGAAGKKSQCIYWDVALPGFGLRKYPNGRGSYVCAYRIQKRKRLVDLGRSDTITLEQARRKARLAEHFELGADALARLHGPVGLKNGARTPPEIAVSILAEITAVRYGYRIPEPVAVAPQLAVPAGCLA